MFVVAKKKKFDFFFFKFKCIIIKYINSISTSLLSLSTIYQSSVCISIKCINIIKVCTTVKFRNNYIDQVYQVYKQYKQVND